MEHILQPFRHFTYVTPHYPTLPSLYLRHASFCNSSVASPTLQLILQPFRHFTYVTSHSPTLPSLYLRHASFSNSSVASPTSQLILQPFFCFSYVTGSSLTSPDEPPMELWIVRMKIKLVVTPQWNKSPLSLSQKWRRGQHQCRQHHNSSCVRERVNTFSVSLENFVSSCSSQTVVLSSSQS